jgi:peptidoglycan/LPS O-acetylase OafA/YrhL
MKKKPNRNFFIRRFFRIAPLFYLAIIYYLFQNGFGPRYALGDCNVISTNNIIATTSFLNGFNPYWINSIVPGGWSIAVEMSFYACIPFLFPKIKNLNHAFLFFILTIMLSSFSTDYLYFYFPSQLPVFALGIMLYFLIIKKEPIWQINIWYLHLFVATITVHYFIEEINTMPSHILYSIGFMFIALLMGKYHIKILVNRLTVFIGSISFGLYLVHFAALNLLEKFNLLNLLGTGAINYLFRYLCVLMISIGIASFLYKFVEQPMQKIGKKWIQKLES